MTRVAIAGAIAAGLLSCALALAATPKSRSAPARGFAATLSWEDGRTEISDYVGITFRRGQPCSTRARLVIGTVNLFSETLAESDEGPIPGRTLEALKASFLADDSAGGDSHHEMASIVLDRTTLTPRKETAARIESAGIRFVRVGPKKGRLTHEDWSSRDADREQPVTWPGNDRPHVWTDALPVTLRAWAAAGSVTTAQDVYLLPSPNAGLSPGAAAQAAPATISAADGGDVSVPAGRFATRRFVVTTGRASDTLWFDRASPHALLRLHTAAGTRLELQKTTRAR